MNLPNKLTLARVLAVPVYVVFMLRSDTPLNYLWAFLIFCIASVTDMIDGKIARKRGLVTDLGKFLDPLADKILVSSALICFADLRWCFSFMVIIIICREFIVSGLRLVAAGNNDHVVIAAGILGKMKTASTMVAMGIITFFHILGDNFGLLPEGFPLSLTANILMGVCTLLTVISGADYLKKYWHLFTKSK
ncbi:MAG: CDP-diacylglycerol--glycerol-3-phosphate 3-phosphatidyltransferase [Firmicutes bacterium]|nr:CDP-diacylglycerol--glycerol-3-phosphate 3-phosphatidyltransferase [[Eubacterium] siraeum]MCM1487270.1 CDP-diacylglycerol--glycerol-3-phosphate 3-phosphatidyltransferase [Bacillota bacterium]